MRSHKTIVRLFLLLSLFVAAAFPQSAPLTFPSQTIPNLVVGNVVGVNLSSQIQGGTSPYTLTLASGTLPPGTNLNGNITGIPTTPGTFTFTLTATDSSTPSLTASQTFTITVVVAPVSILPAPNTVGGVVGKSYSAAYAQGGIPPYNWTITQGTLPASSGLTLSPTTTGQNLIGAPDYAITGTPSAAGTYSFTLQVTDSSTTPVVFTQVYTVLVINPTSYQDPKSTSLPTAITSGPNGDLWFTQQGFPSAASGNTTNHGIESIATNGAFQNEISLPSGPAGTPYPAIITAGPDGYLWVTDFSLNFIYRVKPDGSSVTPIALQTSSATPVLVSPNSIASGNDGGIWFTGTGGSQGYIGRISTDGNNTLNVYAVPGLQSATSIVPDPDGAHLWFLGQANANVAVVGRIGIDGNFDLPAGCQTFNQSIGFSSFTSACLIQSAGAFVPPDRGDSYSFDYVPGPLIAIGSDGAIWFATSNSDGTADMVGRITEDGTNPPSFFPVTSDITSLAVGSDGAIWFASGANLLGRIGTSGQTTSFPVADAPAGNPNTYFLSIVNGPDGALWMTDQHGSAIYQIFPSLALNCTGTTTLPLNVPITNASCTAVGGKSPYTYSFNTNNLSPGVTVSPAGVLSGTPTAAGSFIITATDSSSPVQQASQVFSIQAANPIQFDCNFPTTGTAGQPYSATCSTGGGTGPYTYTVAPSLPAGLTGVATATPSSTPGSTTISYGYSVSGTIGSSVYGTVTFTITAADSTTPTPITSTQTETINVAPIPLALSCPNAQAVAGRAFQETCFGSFGAPPYTFAATGLPAGLTISPSSGVISGTPAAAGQSSVSIFSADTLGETAGLAINLSVVNPELALVCPLPANPTTGTAISATCNTSGGVPPYSYSVSSGTLPAGLTLNAGTGVVSGTPTAVGPATFRLLVTDSESPAVTAQQSVSLFVQPTTLTIVTTTLPAPNPPLPYAAVALAVGGTPPYSFAVSSGALPGGLQLDTVTGVIYTVGTIASGAYSFTVQVTDSANATATQAYSGTWSATPVGQSFASYALPSASGANGITVGQDGNLWFTTLDQTGGNLIGRITTSGVITTTPAANALTQTNTANSELATGGDIAAGPDGEIWIAQRDGNAVGEMAVDLSSQLTYIPPTANSGPAQITAAPDGTLWFTEAAASQIAHVDADGNLMEFPTPSPSSNPAGIVVGPGNFIVFTETAPSVNKIGLITEDGLHTREFMIPTPASLPTSIVLGPDNAFWFTESGANKIGRMDYSGQFEEGPVSSAPQAITVGPDGAFYFTEPAANKIGRVTLAGAVTEIPIPDPNSGPTGIVTGPDGSIWFTESNLSKIGRMSFILAPTVNCTLPTGPLPAASTFSGTCTASQGTPPYQFSFSTAAGSTPPPGVSINPNTGAISGTLTTAGTFSFTVVVTDSSSPALTAQQIYTLTVTPLPLTLTCNTPIGRLYTLYSGGSQSYGCSAANGTPPYTYALTSGTLPPGLSFDPVTANITGTPTTLGDYPITIQVIDSSTPPMSASQGITLSVQYGVITGRGTQLFSLSTAPLSVTPGSNTPGLTLSVNETLLQPVTGTAVLTFTVNPVLVGTGLNTPAGYVDPAFQFVDSSGNPLGTTYNFTFPAGVTSITLPAIDPGTVLGTIDLAINAAGLPQTGTTFPIVGGTPVIEPGSVQFTNMSATGFDVEFVAMVPTRSATTASITFNPTSGDQISGQQTFVFNVGSISNAWFSSADGLQYGGRYSLTIPFVFNGSVSAIGSATVSLDGSQPVTGNR